MQRSEIFLRLKEILQQLGSIDPETLDNCTEATELQTELGLQSVSMLYTVIAIEESFNIRFDDMALDDFKTVGNVIDYIEKAL